jgi:hypothetical protein
VVNSKSLLLVTACATGLLLLMASVADAAVRARVDRNTVDLNESFLLEIVVDSDIDSQPDVSALEADFEVGQSSQLSNTMYINGEITRSRTWTYQLMARRAGNFEIPPVTVGNESSEPILITVREPAKAPPGEADVFITSEVDLDETYVQAQVLYRIKVYRAVPTRQPALRDPDFGGVEVLIEPAGDERSYEARLNDRTYNVVERVYAVFPQESGEVTISPARFEARVLRDGRITGRKVFTSESQTIRVLPIPDPPADFPEAAWLPARDLRLSERWSREIDQLEAGEPITRTVTVSALGLLETQIPVVDPPVVQGVNVYPDRPELTKSIEPGGIRGIRNEQYAMIATKSGEKSLPEMKLPWWDVSAGEWRVATLPGRTISVVSSGEPAVPDEPVQVVAPADDTAQGDVVTVHSELWRRIAESLAVLWLLTLAGWWWSSRPRREREREPKESAPPPVHKQQARCLKTARKAALEGDGAVVRQAMLEWSRLEWPTGAPRSIGELAERVSAPLSDELRALSNAAYGANGAHWDGEAIARYLRSFAVLGADATKKGDDPLPPLMPQN